MANNVRHVPARGTVPAGSGAPSPPLGREITAKLAAVSRRYCESEGGCHGPDHTERVHNLALHIGGMMGAKLEVLSAAALLHDIGRQQETRTRGKICHAEKGAELARKILAECGLLPATIEEVVHCIETHRYRNHKRPTSLEAKILYDADKLDSIGAIGIGRAFLFAGQVGARLHNENNNIENTTSYSVDDTAYREFKVKLCKIKERMLTPEGKRIAEERHAFMKVFFKRLEKEINGDDS